MRIENVRIFDGVERIECGTVEVDDGVITRVEREPTPDAPKREGGPDRTLLPGLIDAHTHAYLSAANLQLALLFGVTTELDMFSFPPWLTSVLCSTANGRHDIADLRSSGTVVSAEGGFASTVLPGLPSLSGPGEAADFVAARQSEGSHHIKLVLDDGAHRGAKLPVLDRETVTAVAAAAAERGLVTVAHISGLWAVRLALESGVTVVTHVPLEEPVDEALAGRLADAGRVAIPTLVMMEMSAAAERGRRLADDARLAAYLPGGVRTAITQGRTGLYVERPSPDVDYRNAHDSVRELHRAGVPVLAGTDANNAPGRNAPVVHGVSLHRELELLVEAGLAPAQALTAATAAPAHHFGLADRGRIAPGMRADLLLVNGDPTVDITSTRAIVAVFKRGVPLDRKAAREVLP